jgi:DNA-binding beta-propeller fold protein YncE
MTAAGAVEVVDLKAGESRRSIGGFKAPVGVAFAPALNRLYVSSRADGTVAIVDGKTYAVLKRVVWPGNPGMVRFDAASKLVFVAFGSNVGFMDADGRQLGTIRLDAAPENFQVSSTSPHVWINIPSSRNIAVADRNSRSVRQTWPVGAAGSGGPNYGITADEKNRRLFVTSRRPATLVTLNLDTGYRIDTRATVANADEVHYDAATGRLYIPGADGQIDVVRQATRDKYEALARVESAPGARTAALDSASGRFFVAVPKRGTQAAEVRVYAVAN